MNEEKQEVRGVEIKISGQCSLVDELVDILYEVGGVVHSSRTIHHEADDGCHIYLTITEVNA